MAVILGRFKVTREMKKGLVSSQYAGAALWLHVTSPAYWKGDRDKAAEGSSGKNTSLESGQLALSLALHFFVYLLPS